MGEMMCDPRKVMSQGLQRRVMKGRGVKDRGPMGGWKNGRLSGQDCVQIILEQSQRVRSKESQKEAGTSVERKE